MDAIPDTPALGRPYCPKCEPDADPTCEILDVRWCDDHAPKRDGLDDELMTAGLMPSGTAEAGGDDNRLWCEIVHGRVSQ